MVEDVRTTAEPAEKAVAAMTPQEARAELAQREADKMTRRAALAKIGIRAGLGLLAAFSVDDLARMVARRMEQQAGQNTALNKVARELHDAGLAYSLPPTDEPTDCYYFDEEGNPYTGPCLNNKCQGACATCCSDLSSGMKACQKDYDDCIARGGTNCSQTRTGCYATVSTAHQNCFNSHSCNCSCATT